MDCPGCHAQVADGTAICPHCDHIIDDSFLSSGEPQEAEPEPEDEGAEFTPVGPAPKAHDKTQVKKQSPWDGEEGTRRTGKTAPAPRRAMPEAPPRTVPRRAAPATARRVSAPEPELTPPQPERAAPPERRVPLGRASAYGTDVPTGLASPEDVLSDLKAFFRSLSFSDRLAFGGAAAVVAACFLPWKDTRAEDEVLGFLSLGFACFLGALLAMGAVVMRVRGNTFKVSPLVPWFVQLASIGFCTLWELFFIRLSWDGRRMMAIAGNYERMVSYPTYGVFLALIFSLVALAGTLLGLRERPAR